MKRLATDLLALALVVGSGVPVARAEEYQRGSEYDPLAGYTYTDWVISG